ncbi:MAG: hypothetical protein ABH870_00255 [bacterium]
MLTQQSSKCQGEAGMAILMAVFVALFLLAVSLAYIVCSKNSLNQAQLSQGKVKGVVVAEAGMERALWYLQERADTNQAIEDGNLLGNYDELLKGYRDKDVARNQGLNIPEMGTNTRYAVRTVWEDDGVLIGTSTNGSELAIYVIGVTRQANLMGMEVSNIKSMKMLIRVGAREGGLIEAVVGTRGQVIESGNSRWQGKGNIYTEAGFVQDATPNTTIKSPDTPHTSNDQLIISEWDTWLKGTDLVLDGPWDKNGITEQDTTDIKLLKGTSQSQQLPEINVSDFATAKGDYAGLDYTYQDLIDRGWTISDGAIISPIGEVMSIWEIPPGTASNGIVTELNQTEPWVNEMVNGMNTYPAEDIRKGAYYDRNGDGYTTIYLGQGSLNLRIMPYGGGITSLWIRPGARGIIASQGQGNNYYAADGIGTWGNSGMGADIEPKSDVSVEIRGQISGGPGEAASTEKQVYVDNAVCPNRGGTEKGVVGLFNPLDPMGENWGAFSIIAQNDVIISDCGEMRESAQSDSYDPCSAFRGFVYSKTDIKIQTDILIQGMIIGLSSVNFADQGSCGWGLASYGDGFDPSFYYENALNPSGSGMSFFPIALAPSGQKVNSRNMTVLSWEADKFYKKKI